MFSRWSNYENRAKIKITYFIFCILIVAFATAIVLFDPDFFKNLKDIDIFSDVANALSGFGLAKVVFFSFVFVSSSSLAIFQLIASASPTLAFCSDVSQDSIIGCTKALDTSRRNGVRASRAVRKKFKRAIDCISVGDIDGATVALLACSNDYPSGEIYLNLGYLELIKGDYGKALDYFSSGISTKLADNKVKYLLLLNTGSALMALSKLSESSEIIITAFVHAQNDLEKACACHNLGINLKLRGRYSEALSNITFAANIFEKESQSALLLRSKLLLSDINSDLGNFERSEHFLKEANSILVASKKTFSFDEAFVCHVKSRVNIDLGKLQLASQNAEMARGIYYDHGHIAAYILSSVNLAEALRLLGRLPESLAIIDEARKFAKDGSYEGAYLLLAESLIYLDTQEFDKCLDICESAEKDFRLLTHFSEALLCTLNRGFVHILKEDVGVGIAITCQLLDDDLKGVTHEIKANAFLNLARAYLMVSSYKEAKIFLNKSSEIINNGRNPTLQGEFLCYMGVYCSSTGERDRAESYFNDACSIFKKSGASLYLGDVYFEMGYHYKKHFRQNMSQEMFRNALTIYRTYNARSVYIDRILQEQAEAKPLHIT